MKDMKRDQVSIELFFVENIVYELNLFGGHFNDFRFNPLYVFIRKKLFLCGERNP